MSTTLVELAAHAAELELDERWSFVLKKSRKRWIWIALGRHSRQVVAYVIGERSAATWGKLWEGIAAD